MISSWFFTRWGSGSARLVSTVMTGMPASRVSVRFRLPTGGEPNRSSALPCSCPSAEASTAPNQIRHRLHILADGEELPSSSRPSFHCRASCRSSTSAGAFSVMSPHKAAALCWAGLPAASPGKFRFRSRPSAVSRRSCSAPQGLAGAARHPPRLQVRLFQQGSGVPARQLVPMHAAHDVNRRAVGRAFQQRYFQRLPVGGGQVVGAACGGVFRRKAVKVRRGQGLQRRRVRQLGQRRGGRRRSRGLRRRGRAGRGARLRLRRPTARQQQGHRGAQQAPQQCFFIGRPSFLSGVLRLFAPKAPPQQCRRAGKAGQRR